MSQDDLKKKKEAEALAKSHETRRQSHHTILGAFHLSRVAATSFVPVTRAKDQVHLDMDALLRQDVRGKTDNGYLSTRYSNLLTVMFPDKQAK